MKIGGERNVWVSSAVVLQLLALGGLMGRMDGWMDGCYSSWYPVQDTPHN